MEYVKAMLVLPILTILIAKSDGIVEITVGVICTVISLLLILLYSALRDHKRVARRDHTIVFSAIIAFFVKGFNHLYLGFGGSNPTYMVGLQAISDIGVSVIGVAIVYTTYDRWRNNLGQKSVWEAIIIGMKRIL